MDIGQYNSGIAIGVVKQWLWRAKGVSCFVALLWRVRSPYFSWIWKLRCSAGLPQKSVCRQMITFSSLMDKGHSPVVNNCPLFIVLQTALLFLLVWAPPVVGNSSTWDTQRPLDRTATLCDRELCSWRFVLPPEVIRDSTEESSATVQEEVFWWARLSNKCDWSLCR